MKTTFENLKIKTIGVRKAPGSGDINPNYFPTINGKRVCHYSMRRDLALAMAQRLAGFDPAKRRGNSAMIGHGVNSQAMMEARRNAPLKNPAKTPSQHTPGPWTVGAHVENDWEPNHFIIQRGKGEIAHVYFGQAEEQHANARLIAAAPDLLAALEAAQTAIDYYDEHEGAAALMPQVKAAIAQARGGKS